jgi:hypothetical protein
LIADKKHRLTFQFPLPLASATTAVPSGFRGEASFDFKAGGYGFPPFGG